MKPTLAVDADFDKLTFPKVIMPKIDGVRGLNVDGELVARSLKPFKNKALTELFSTELLNGFDGELVAGGVTAPDLCRRTTSQTGTIKATSDGIGWCLFDYVTDETAHLPYWQRHQTMYEKVADLRRLHPELGNRLWVIPVIIADNLNELLQAEEIWLQQGYEGLIIRDPDGRYKFGRTTQNEQLYLRVKRFLDGECEILKLVEGETNNNEAQTNELGETYRTSHQAGKVPNGLLASFEGRVLKDIIDPQTKETLIKKDQIIVVTAGKMSHDQRADYWANPDKILGKIAKFQFFPKGQKDKPRFPTFQTFRDPIDM